MFEDKPLFEMLKRGRCDGLLCGLCMHHVIAEAKTGSSVAEIRQKFQVQQDQYLVWDSVDSESDPFAILIANKCLMHRYPPSPPPLKTTFFNIPSSIDFRCNTEIKVAIEGFSSGEELGIISKIWGPRLQMVNMDHEMFYMQMDEDLPVRHKAALLVAGFLMHYVYMEIS